MQWYIRYKLKLIYQFKITGYRQKCNNQTGKTLLYLKNFHSIVTWFFCLYERRILDKLFYYYEAISIVYSKENFSFWLMKHWQMVRGVASHWVKIQSIGIWLKFIWPFSFEELCRKWLLLTTFNIKVNIQWP